MGYIRMVRSALFAILAITMSCGCSSGGGGAVMPSLDSESGLDAGFNSVQPAPPGTTPESRFQSDPRFIGFIGDPHAGARAGEGIQFPSFPHVRYDQPWFDGMLHGCFSDPRKELDPMTLCGKIDNETDITNLLR